MATLAYDKQLTALLVVDPYNDFISEGGKIWPRIKAVAEANKCVPNMLQVLNAARDAKLRVIYAMHHRYRPGDYESCAISAATRGSVFIRNWVAPIRALIVPKGCSTVSRRFSGCSSSRRCTASRTCSWSHREISRSLLVVQLCLTEQL